MPAHLAVPVPMLGECLAGIAPHLRPGQVVVDVCSVKAGPAALMRRLLPEGVEILATHPMFGPQSMPQSLSGGRIVICPLRGGRWRRIAAFLRRVLGVWSLVSVFSTKNGVISLNLGNNQPFCTFLFCVPFCH